MTSDCVLTLDEPVPTPLCVVRLRTSMWSDRRGLYCTRSLTYLKRQSSGEFLKEDVDAEGAAETFPRIINLDTCPDGVYTVLACHEQRDFETGAIDDYDFQLVPCDDHAEKGRVRI